MKDGILYQGAEARILKAGEVLIKERVRKEYRITQLDEKLRIRRTRSEANLLRESRRIGVLVPRVLGVEKYSIEIEQIEGFLVKESINENNLEDIGQKIGRQIALLHEYDIIHGDLTTSNMILKGNNIYFIDFGLGFHSGRIEDKSIDLYLLYHSIEATHWKILEKIWNIIIDAYKAYKNADKVIKTLNEIEKRGRYKKR